MIDTKVMRRNSNLVGWIIIIPMLVSIALFVVYPLIYSVCLSFTDYRFVNNNVKFIGLKNYAWLFNFSNADSLAFWNGLGLSFFFTFFSTLIQTFLGFLMAYVLYKMGRRVQSVYKILVYIPVILPMAMVTVMFKFFLSPEGIVNTVLSRLGMVNPPQWLADDSLTMWVVIAINTWRFIGMTIIIYFVAMNNVDASVIESAKLDGAGNGTIMAKMILPLTWSSTRLNLLTSMIGGMKSYDFFLILTDGTGNTTVAGMYIYKMAYEYRVFCRAVTMSIVLSIIIGTATFLVNKYAERGDQYA